MSELARFSAGEIAAMTALASFVVAIVAGTFGLATAFVNAHAARRLAQTNSRRDHHLNAAWVLPSARKPQYIT